MQKPGLEHLANEKIYTKMAGANFTAVCPPVRKPKKGKDSLQRMVLRNKPHEMYTFKKIFICLKISAHIFGLTTF